MDTKHLNKLHKSLDKIIDKAVKKRIELNLSQKELAEYIGTSRTSIINFEKKRRHMPYDKTMLLLNRLSVL